MHEKKLDILKIIPVVISVCMFTGVIFAYFATVKGSCEQVKLNEVKIEKNYDIDNRQDRDIEVLKEQCNQIPIIASDVREINKSQAVIVDKLSMLIRMNGNGVR